MQQLLDFGGGDIGGFIERDIKNAAAFFLEDSVDGAQSQETRAVPYAGGYVVIVVQHTQFTPVEFLKQRDYGLSFYLTLAVARLFKLIYINIIIQTSNTYLNPLEVEYQDISFLNGCLHRKINLLFKFYGFSFTFYFFSLNQSKISFLSFFLIYYTFTVFLYLVIHFINLCDFF